MLLSTRVLYLTYRTTCYSSSVACEPRAAREHDVSLVGSVGVAPAALIAARVAATSVGARAARFGHELRVHSRRVLAADGVLVAHRHAAGHSA